MGLWKINPWPRLVIESQSIVQRQLEAAGLQGTEVYPQPAKTKGSLGKCHRRPCGMDSGIITALGLITDPIEQIRLFMHPPTSHPIFEIICGTIFDKLAEMYEQWVKWKWDEGHNTIPSSQRPEKVAELDAELLKVKDWLNSGCPLDRIIIPVAVNVPVAAAEPKEKKKKPPTTALSQPPIEIPRDNYPESFCEVDLRTINASGQWVEFCIFLATYGFPCDDRFVEVISTLTKWFAFYEFYTPEIDRKRTKEVLKLFCLHKHNTFITRLNNGRDEEVLAHVDRVVDGTIDSMSEEGIRLFSEMRATRDRGHYPTIHRLVDLCTNNSSSFSSSLCPILCGVLRNERTTEKTEDWTYLPDETELPEKLIEIIQQGFQQAGIQLRKNKTGKYPTIEAITRFINYLYAGTNRGTRRASKILLEQMGFPAGSKKKERIKAVMQKAKIIQIGDYRALSLSRSYSLTEEVLRVLDDARTKPVTPLPQDAPKCD